MYLGDSENDNAAFRKADISIGVHSDPRLKPKLDCDYIITFDKLSFFMKSLLNNGLDLSPEMVVN